MNDQETKDDGGRVRLALYGPAMLALVFSLMWKGGIVLAEPILAILIARALWLLWHSENMSKTRKYALAIFNCLAILPAVYWTVAIVLMLKNPFPQGLQ